VSVYDLYQSYLNAQKQVAPEPSLGILDPRLLYPQNYQGGGDGPRGGGAFGNLDMSKGKEVTRDVYQDVLGPPGAFEFSPETMMAYPNLSSGLYQTYEGRNVDSLLSNTGATFGLAGLGMKMLGMQPKTVGGFVPGSIRGIFDTPSDILRFISGADRREAQAAQEAAQQQSFVDAATAKRNIQQYTGGGGGGGGRGTHTATKSASQAAANREGRRGGQYR
jgi:hypothetical protein